MDIEGFVTTFRIKKSTTFKEIYNVACKFWELNEQKYILTDEYFNNLELYGDSIWTFFKNYKTLNPDEEAVVYLVQANREKKDENEIK